MLFYEPLFQTDKKKTKNNNLQHLAEAKRSLAKINYLGTP